MMFKLKRSKADALFSDYVRERAKWSCEYCKAQFDPPTKSLHCSHFYGRGAKSVRFDPENAAALCFSCHQYLGSHPSEHYKFFMKRLGKEKMDLLELRFHTPQKVDEKLIVMWCKDELKKLKQDRPTVFGER